jgi:hypothetical protein
MTLQIPARWRWNIKWGVQLRPQQDMTFTRITLVVCTGNLTALSRCWYCGRLHHLTRAAALFHRACLMAEISPSRWLIGRLLSVCFQSFLTMWIVSASSWCGLYANLIASKVHKINVWSDDGVKVLKVKNLKVLTPLTPARRHFKSMYIHA